MFRIYLFQSQICTNFNSEFGLPWRFLWLPGETPILAYALFTNKTYGTLQLHSVECSVVLCRAMVMFIVKCRV